MEIKNNNKKGFALLITLLVLGVVIAVGLSVLELSQKQVKLSSNSAGSETAFHAANGGIECARYWRRKMASDFENTTTNVNNLSCFNNTQDFDIDTSAVISTTGVGSSAIYKAEYDWGLLNRCSAIEMLVMKVDVSAGSDYVVDNITDIFPGYPDGSTKTCSAGGLCTVIVSYGYSAPCANKNIIGTVQREVLVQF